MLLPEPTPSAYHSTLLSPFLSLALTSFQTFRRVWLSPFTSTKWGKTLTWVAIYIYDLRLNFSFFMRVYHIVDFGYYSVRSLYITVFSGWYSFNLKLISELSSMGTRLISYWVAYRHVLGGLTHLHGQALVTPSTSLLAYNYVAVNCVRLEINQIFTSNDHVFCSEVNKSRTAAATRRIMCVSWQDSPIVMKYPAGLDRLAPGYCYCSPLFSWEIQVLG